MQAQIQAYKKALKKQCPDIPEGKLALGAFLLIGMRAQDTIETRESAEHHSIAVKAKQDEVISTMTNTMEGGSDDA